MGLEVGSFIEDLVTTNPVGNADPKSAGDDHLRLIKTVVKATFPGLAGRFARLQNKVASYNLVANDNTSQIVFTAGSSLVLGSAVAASVLGNGFQGCCINVSGGAVTFDANGSETINGQATLSIPDDYGLLYWCDGANWYGILISMSPAQTVPTGETSAYIGSSAPAGYVLASGRTIGSASSNATERANADTVALYTLIWESVANAEAPIQDSSGTPTTRGANAASDFAANKRLPLPDLRDRVIIGKGNMGGTAANRITVGVGNIDTTVLAKAGGHQAVGSHTHGYDDYYQSNSSSAQASYQSEGWVFIGNVLNAIGEVGATTPRTTAANGSPGDSGNIQPGIVMNAIIKL